MAFAVTLHLLSAVIWVGGMFFAVYVLRLAAGPMEPTDRIALWSRSFKKFFPWVWCAVILLISSGYYITFVGYAGFKNLPILYHVMHLLGWLMVMLYLHLWFAPYSRFKRAVEEENMAVAGQNLNQIRIIVTANLWLGLLNIILGATGKYIN